MGFRITPRSDEIDPSSRRGGRFTDCTLVGVLRRNPYRPGSDRSGSYQLFLEAPGRRMTYDQYRDRGGRNSHLRHAVDHGYVDVIGPGRARSSNSTGGSDPRPAGAVERGEKTGDGGCLPLIAILLAVLWLFSLVEGAC